VKDRTVTSGEGNCDGKEKKRPEDKDTMGRWKNGGGPFGQSRGAERPEERNEAEGSNQVRVKEKERENTSRISKSSHPRGPGERNEGCEATVTFFGMRRHLGTGWDKSRSA